MKLYHYAANPFEYLKTKRLQGGMTADQIKEAEVRSQRLGTIAPYIDHISFFFDPLPMTLLAEIFKVNGKYKEPHRVWVKGNVLYEHVIETDSLDPHCLWEVVESLKSIAFFDDFVEKHNWVDDDPAILKLYLEKAKENAIAWGERGNGLPGLMRQIKANQNVTEKAYQAAWRRQDFAENRMKYAASVPHLMFYPRGGEVPVSQINKVTVGNAKRERV